MSSLSVLIRVLISCGWARASSGTTEQTIFGITKPGWNVNIDPTWDVLGPFPIAAREQYFLSPSYPIELDGESRYEHEPNRTYPSSLADGGLVGWSKTVMSPDGQIDVVYPDVRWASLRSTEGWAILQHHSVLRTTINITPSLDSNGRAVPLDLLMSVTQASFFALLPRSSHLLPEAPVEWHTGNIYGLQRYSPSVIQLPPSSQEMAYDIFVSADYEIRLFGDPIFSAGRPEPVSKVKVAVSIEERRDMLKRTGHDDVVMDFVDGWSMGDAIGVGIRAGAEWVELRDVQLHAIEGVSVSLVLPTGTPAFRLAPKQNRIVPLRLSQTARLPSKVSSLLINLVFHSSAGLHTVLSTSLPVRHVPHWSNHDRQDSLKTTYFLSFVPTLFISVPPLRPLPPTEAPRPVLLALHGAGVSLSFPFWPAAVPRQNYSWIVFPQGSTEWGMDWHGPSAQDAWGCVDAIKAVVGDRAREWQHWAPGSETVALGHSNGGQGTWYFAGRWPDRLKAAIPSSAYLTAPHYVPLTYAKSTHFTDPSLRGILDASLMQDSNDLFLSNVVTVPILALHGGMDENVPVWHSREAVAGVLGWWKEADIRFVEEVGRPHWWDDVFKSQHVQDFLQKVLNEPNSDILSPDRFTLTVACPEESGSMYGWAITELEIRGRLGKLDIRKIGPANSPQRIEVKSTNVHAFVVGDIAEPAYLILDGEIFGLPGTGNCSLRRNDLSTWEITYDNVSQARPSGPMSRILTTSAPLLVIVPSHNAHSLSVATRLAHSVFLYVRVDAEILSDVEALSRWEEGTLSEGHLVVIGGKDNRFGVRLLDEKRSAFSINDSNAHISLEGKVFEDPSAGFAFLHVHPLAPKSFSLFLCGSDASGLERIIRLFPLRTGVPLPEWLGIGKHADWKGMGGILGAGRVSLSLKKRQTTS